MRVVIGSDKESFDLKEKIKEFLENRKYTVVDVCGTPSDDFVDSTSKVVAELLKDDEALGIVFDGYGAGSFMVATKYKGIIAAEISDERSAYMTREHNNTRLITLGSLIIGEELAKNIVSEFLSADYDGGRHQVRVDMLNKMC